MGTTCVVWDPRTVPHKHTAHTPPPVSPAERSRYRGTSNEEEGVPQDSGIPQHTFDLSATIVCAGVCCRGSLPFFVCGTSGTVTALRSRSCRRLSVHRVSPMIRRAWKRMLCSCLRRFCQTACLKVRALRNMFVPVCLVDPK